LVMDNIGVYYQNARGLRTKPDIFFEGVTTSDFNVICITKTWLTQAISSNEYFTDEYCVYRCDRDSTDSRATLGDGCSRRCI
ncbi:hypothetical protein IscW_ISCW011648, partial [Ixodes scapularis]